MKLNIEELAKQADPEFGNGEGDMPDALCGMAAIEAFARLIVERCATVADSSGHHWSGPTAHAMFDCAEKIRNLLEAE